MYGHVLGRCAHVLPVLHSLLKPFPLCYEQYTTLAQHKLEGLDELIGFFFSLIDGFKRKRHDLLDFQRNEFDRDYVEFNARIQELEGAFVCVYLYVHVCGLIEVCALCRQAAAVHQPLV